eukprot:337188-Pyramimonas_sp.AAC.1
MWMRGPDREVLPVETSRDSLTVDAPAPKTLQGASQETTIGPKTPQKTFRSSGQLRRVSCLDGGWRGYFLIAAVSREVGRRQRRNEQTAA